MNTLPDRAIIVGAGASVDFGLPLGRSLLTEGIGLIQDFRSKWRKLSKQNRGFFRLDDLLAAFSTNEEYSWLLDMCKDDRGSYSLSVVQDLVTSIENAPIYSLDTLVLERPELEEVCQRLTYLVLKRHIRAATSVEHGVLKEVSFFKPILKDKTDNWIHAYFSVLRNRLSVTPSSRVAIISFNYDMIFEKSLRKLWEFPSRDLGTFDDRFEVLYPHGCMEWNVNSSDLRFLGDHSGIVFAHKKKEARSIDRIQTIIGSASEIVSLGFAFSRENVDTFGLRKHDSSAILRYQNYDENPGLDARVDQQKFAFVERFNGGIAPAIWRGAVGDLPS